MNKLADKMLAAYQAVVLALLAYAAPSPVGRNTSDPIYRKIVEGRVFPGYSSCADLAHWLYYRLGVRESWINRAEFSRDIGGQGWISQVNLNRWCGKGVGPNPFAQSPAVAHDWAGDQTELFAMGDVFVIANSFGGHVLCVRGWANGKLLTTEYGQPGGMPREHAVTVGKPAGEGVRRAVFCGSSQVTFRVRLAECLGELQASGRLAALDIGCLAGSLGQDAANALAAAISGALAAPAAPEPQQEAQPAWPVTEAPTAPEPVASVRVKRNG
jgi:hypothetical protein